jgi:hypothetical protein
MDREHQTPTSKTLIDEVFAVRLLCSAAPLTQAWAISGAIARGKKRAKQQRSVYYHRCHASRMRKKTQTRTTNNNTLFSVQRDLR